MGSVNQISQLITFVCANGVNCASNDLGKKKNGNNQRRM
jgi:hypothetical protein